MKEGANKWQRGGKSGGKGAERRVGSDGEVFQSATAGTHGTMNECARM